ncbi:MAG: N-6 DNA methylase, partial [Chloroflexales bacterium]|nr:N-6 DNA methylase [Chloroflexales bacterium]
MFEADGKGQTLSIMPLAGDLFNPQAIGILAECAIANHDLLQCILLLSRYTPPKGVPTRVNYAALNVEEFGSVYEGLLGYTPIVQSSNGTRQFSFRELQGNDRKTSGSYYTPDSLVQAVLDSALNPVIAQAQQGKKPAEAARALRALRICEPAVGSGHFLLGAARRLADAIARADAEVAGASEYAPSDYQRALRDVTEHCVYGVDINPMSAELCRVALWIESHEPGKPLSFLDHHIQVGNSLLGTTPEHILAGIPDEAYVALTGDDKATVSALKKRNKAERKPLGPMFATQDAHERDTLRHSAAALNALASDDVQTLYAKGQSYRAYLQSAAYRHQKRIADAWCAAFVAPKDTTSATFGQVAAGITTGTIHGLLAGDVVSAPMAEQID